MNASHLKTLGAVADRIVPPEPDGSGVCGRTALPYVLREIAPGGAASEFSAELTTLLEAIETAAGGDFADRTVDAQDAILARCETDLETAPAFRLLAELVTEGFYTSAEGMALVGFEPVTSVQP